MISLDAGLQIIQPFAVSTSAVWNPPQAATGTIHETGRYGAARVSILQGAGHLCKSLGGPDAVAV